MGDLVRLIRTAAWLSLCAALYQELRKPPEERTWHGRVLGAVPYDLRLPTIERLRKAYWDPSSDVIFTDRVFGVGWAVNLPVLARKLSAAASQYAEISKRVRRRGAPGEEGPEQPT